MGGTNADEEIYRKAQEAAADYLAELGVEDEGEEEQEGEEEEEEEQDGENWDEEEEEDEEGDVAAGIDLLNAHVMQPGVNASNWYRLLLWVLVKDDTDLCVFAEAPLHICLGFTRYNCKF